MIIRMLTLVGVVIVLSGTLTSAWAADSDLQQVIGGGFTVAYPVGLETQAKHILDVAKESITPSMEINKQMVSFLANADSMAVDIATLLGCVEKQPKAREYLLAYKSRSEALIQCFTNIRLVRKADAVVAGGLDAGILRVGYDKDKDEFSMIIDTDDASPDKVKRSYFPIFVNADGSIRAEKKLGEMAIDFMGSNKRMIIAPVHETVASLMVKDLNLYYPFARWFNEGVSAWVCRQVIAKTDPRLAKTAGDLFAVGATAAKYRDKVNFLAWPQRAFENQRDPDSDPAMEVAQTQYAIEMITNLLGKNGSQILPKIMREVSFNSNADTTTILAAINKVTGKDFKPTLMTYVPKAIRDGIASGEPKKLTARAEALVGEKKLGDAAAKLKLALRMTPADVNARLNLAWIERELGSRLDAEIQVFVAARLMDQGEHSFHLYGASLEGNYILGRFAILMGNLEYAKKFLEPVLEAKPDHAEAKKAMEEIKSLERAAGAPSAEAAK